MIDENSCYGGPPSRSQPHGSATGSGVVSGTSWGAISAASRLDLVFGFLGTVVRTSKILILLHVKAYYSRGSYLKRVRLLGVVVSGA